MTKSVKEKTRLQKIKDYKSGESEHFDSSMVKLNIKIDSAFYDDKKEEFYSVNRRIYKEAILKYKDAIKVKLIPLIQKTGFFDFTLKLDVMTHFQEGYDNHHSLTGVLYVNRDVFSGNPFFINLNTEENQEPPFSDFISVFELLVDDLIKTENSSNFKIIKDGAFLPYVKGLKLFNRQFKDTYFYNDIYRLYNFFHKYKKELKVTFLEYEYDYIKESIDLTLYDDLDDYKCIIQSISYDDVELIINIYESGFIHSARENLDGLTLEEILDEHCMLTY